MAIKNCANRRERRGFTLLELLIVLAIILITVLIAIPTFQHIVQENRMATTVNHLVGALRYARSTAIQSRSSVSLCPYLSEHDCGDDWSRGIMILSSKAKLLRIIPPLKYGRLTWNRKGNVIQMLPTGALKGQNGTFSYWPDNGSKRICGRAIILSKTGRIRIKEIG